MLNLSFDFSHILDGHTFRITRVPDNLNKYELRIDNQNFEDIMAKRGEDNKETSEFSKDFKKTENDPFADFGNLAK